MAAAGGLHTCNASTRYPQHLVTLRRLNPTRSRLFHLFLCSSFPITMLNSCSSLLFSFCLTQLFSSASVLIQPNLELDASECDMGQSCHSIACQMVSCPLVPFWIPCLFSAKKLHVGNPELVAVILPSEELRQQLVLRDWTNFLTTGSALLGVPLAQSRETRSPNPSSLTPSRMCCIDLYFSGWVDHFTSFSASCSLNSCSSVLPTYLFLQRTSASQSETPSQPLIAFIFWSWPAAPSWNKLQTDLNMKELVSLKRFYDDFKRLWGTAVLLEVSYLWR